MALAGKQSGNMHNLTGRNKAKLQTKFDGNFHDIILTEPDSNPILASILYTMQNLTEDIDHLRTYAGSELKGLVNTNTAKTTFPGIGTTSTKCKAGNTTTISSVQSEAISNTTKTLNNLRIINGTKGTISFGPPDARNGNMVIQVIVDKKKFNYTLSPLD